MLTYVLLQFTSEILDIVVKVCFCTLPPEYGWTFGELHFDLVAISKGNLTSLDRDNDISRGELTRPGGLIRVDRGQIGGFPELIHPLVFEEDIRSAI